MNQLKLLLFNDDADCDRFPIEDRFNPIHSVSWSPDGYLLSASDDKNINKWTDNKTDQKELLYNSLDSFSTTLSVNSKSIVSKVSM